MHLLGVIQLADVMCFAKVVGAQKPGSTALAAALGMQACRHTHNGARLAVMYVWSSSLFSLERMPPLKLGCDVLLAVPQLNITWLHLTGLDSGAHQQLTSASQAGIHRTSSSVQARLLNDLTTGGRCMRFCLSPFRICNSNLVVLQGKMLSCMQWAPSLSHHSQASF